MKIKILYEDKDIVVIEKPSGVSVHPSANSEINSKKEKFITTWVLENYPKMKNVGELLGDVVRPGIVHRLDKETSGVLLLAKNQKAYEFLKEQFQNKKIKKTYVAIVNGYVKNDKGLINKPIGRSPTDFRKRLAGRGARGLIREAITEYKVLERFETLASKDLKNFTRCKFSYLEIYPKTGRTHQIRVHMKFFSHPVVGDSLYNSNGEIPKGLSRMALHAKSIEFTDLKGKKINIESKVPKEIEKIAKI